MNFILKNVSGCVKATVAANIDLERLRRRRKLGKLEMDLGSSKGGRISINKRPPITSKITPGCQRNRSHPEIYTLPYLISLFFLFTLVLGSERC